jgi:hypothetical protein
MQEENADAVQQSNALKTIASRIIFLASQLLKGIKIEYLGPCYLDGTQLSDWEIMEEGYAGPIGYGWIKGDIPDELKQIQRDVIEAYQIWYITANQFIKKYNPDCEDMSKAYYNDILNYLQLDNSILDTDNNRYIINKFNDVFHLQASILKGTLSIIGNKELISALETGTDKIEREPIYDINRQLAGRDINQAGRDIIVIANPPAKDNLDSTRANLEMLVKGTKNIYL